MMRDIIIPFKSSINFLKEYYNVYSTQNAGNNPFYDIQTNVAKLTNPINVWVLIEYGKLRSEYNKYMGEYNLRDAISVLFKLVQILNNGYIKLGRSFLKGRDGNSEWSQSLSTLYYVLKYFISDFKAIIPFFCEQQYLELQTLFGSSDSFFPPESIHLNESLSFETYIQIPEAQVFLATDFDIVYNIIFTGLQLRSINNHSVKKPLRSIQIIIDDKFEQVYSHRYREFLDFIANEVNSLDIKVVKSSDLIIKKEIKPNKGALYKKYTKSISAIYEELVLMNSEQLDQLIQKGVYKDIVLDDSLFISNCDITIVNQEPNSIYEFKELAFGTNKITVVIDKYYDEEIDKLYYYRLVATKIQRSRKYANLHPWDKINAYYSGMAKYDLCSEQAQQIIQSICKVNLIKLDGQETFYSKQFEDLDVQLFLQMV
jgi:isoleucyl-tRNA synthetase